MIGCSKSLHGSAKNMVMSSLENYFRDELISKKIGDEFITTTFFVISAAAPPHRRSMLQSAFSNQ
jgi:hypothetical protein